MEAQPSLSDALMQAIIEMHDDKLIILSLNHTLRVGDPIPYNLLELFNMTQLADQQVLKHTKLVSIQIKDEEIR